MKILVGPLAEEWERRAGAAYLRSVMVDFCCCVAGCLDMKGLRRIRAFQKALESQRPVGML